MKSWIFYTKSASFSTTYYIKIRTVPFAYYKQVIHSHMPVKLHFCVINIPNIRGHGEMSKIMDHWLWGYKIELFFHKLRTFFHGKKMSGKNTDVCPWPQTNDREHVYNTGHRWGLYMLWASNPGQAGYNCPALALKMEC